MTSMRTDQKKKDNQKQRNEPQKQDVNTQSMLRKRRVPLMLLEALGFWRQLPATAALRQTRREVESVNRWSVKPLWVNAFSSRSSSFLEAVSTRQRGKPSVSAVPASALTLHVEQICCLQPCCAAPHWNILAAPAALLFWRWAHLTIPRPAGTGGHWSSTSLRGK